jgi:uncharacterized protein YoxC
MMKNFLIAFGIVMFTLLVLSFTFKSVKADELPYEIVQQLKEIESKVKKNNRILEDIEYKLYSMEQLLRTIEGKQK